MKTINLTLLLQFAGLLHLGLIWAGLMMPRAVNLRANLARAAAVYFPAVLGLLHVHRPVPGELRPDHLCLRGNAGRRKRAGPGVVRVLRCLLDNPPLRGDVYI